MKKLLIIMVSSLFLLFSACNRGPKITRTDTTTSGYASIASDECFAPIVKEELAVFTGMNPEADIQPTLAGENEVFDLLLNDSVRLIIAARDISLEEKEFLQEKKLNVRSQKIAIDGIALIANKENKDTLISVSMLKNIMTGTISDWKNINSNSSLGEIKVVFDNPSSSTLRFITDSICKGEVLSDNLKALNSSIDVIEYVEKTPNAIGIIGVNWISNPNDTTNLSFSNKINVLSVSRERIPTKEDSYKPYPAYLGLGYYPLVRDVYIIISDVRGGLPSGFVQFVAGDKGQRIILKAGLVPATRPTRLITIKDNF